MKKEKTEKSELNLRALYEERRQLKTIGLDPKLYEEGDKQMEEILLEHWKKGNVKRVLCMMSNESGMAFVVDNWPLLKERGKYEEALLEAYTGIKTNYSRWSIYLLKFLFNQADIKKLRKIGDHIPDRETFTLYRGVSGKGRARRINSFSWTQSPNTAAWFAMRPSQAFHDPAVYTVTVPNKCVMAYSNERKEKEYLLRLPLPVKPRRLKELPEAFLPEDKFMKNILEGKRLKKGAC